jgi:hypothetical protein
VLGFLVTALFAQEASIIIKILQIAGVNLVSGFKRPEAERIIFGCALVIMGACAQAAQL